MTLFFKNFLAPGRVGRLAACALFGAAVCVPLAQAQEDAISEATTTPVPPYSLLQYSTLTGTGNTITATWVPVVNSTGQTSYHNITIELEVSSTGVLTIAPGYPKIVASPQIIVSGFKAGTYVGPSTLLGGKAIVNVAGPGVAPGGATEWSLAAGSGANPYTFPCSATWYDGPIANNPLYSRLKAAGITSTAWQYGVIGSAGCDAEDGYWYPRSLIGLSQTGNTLTIVTFSYAGTTDYNSPRDQVTYTRSQ